MTDENKVVRLGVLCATTVLLAAVVMFGWAPNCSQELDKSHYRKGWNDAVETAKEAEKIKHNAKTESVENK